MALLLPPQVYGAQTEALQSIIANAEAMPLLCATGVSAETSRVAGLVEEHLCALASATGADFSASGVRLVGGSVAWLESAWPRAKAWRDALSALIGEMNAKHERVGVSRLVPPIWLAGAINVFGIVLIATEDNWSRCSARYERATQRQILWEVLCLAEMLVDAALVATLFDDRAIAVFAPLLSLMRVGVVPAGLDDDGFFICLELSVREDAERTHPFAR